MPLSSLELARRCHAKGLLSKEAMDDVLRIRRRLYKKAMEEKAAGFFGTFGKRVIDAGKAVGGKASSFMDDLKGQLGFAGMTGAKPAIHTPRTAPTFEEIGTIAKDLPKSPKSWAEFTGDLGKMLALGAGLQGAGMGVAGLMRHSRDKEVKRDIEKSYKDMFAETPTLANLDPQKVTRHFDVLARYAPSLAADPTVAGAWVRGTVQMGHIDSTAVERLGATQALIDRHHEGRALFQPGHFHAAIGLATKAMSGGSGGSSGGGGGGG
jgi:hypothetical protein